MMTNYIAQIAIDNTTYSFDRLFDYSVPSNLVSELAVGMRVLVPFGRGNQLRQGMVMYIKQGDVDKLKSISSILDSTPVLTQEMIKLAEFIKDRYFCTYYDAVKVMLPAGINYNVTTLYQAKKDVESDEDFSADEKQIYEYLLRRKKPVKAETIRDDLGFSDNTLLDKMVQKGYLLKSDGAVRKIGDAVMKMVSLSENAEDMQIKLSAKQSEVFELLQTVGSASVKEICYYTGVTTSVVDALVKKQLAFYYEEEVFRNSDKSVVKENKEIILSEEQNNAYKDLYARYKQNKPAVSLLYGITGSGKTSVFIKLIESVIKDNKGIIVMVPEISLTPQFVNIFKTKFGDDVAVFHSGLSLGQRLDEYKRVKRGIAKIAIGTRSAVFAPFENLGLIIIDEEQEHTYKSESTPRYHTREVAKFRVKEHNCLLLLSSATPDVETYYHAQQGTYSFNKLTHRYGSAELPQVLIADMNEEVAVGNTSQFSEDLLDCIENNLNKGNQSILLLNRRGHNTFAVCSNCKETITCPNCSISLTFHSANGKLMCHYCGYSMQYSHKCPTCQQPTLRFGGAGTQRVEQELSDIFPDARILRLDADATMRKFAYEKKLNAFAKGDYDILIGTQMVAKGLDFPKVTLVGVLNPDSMLYADDYRSYERSFSLLTQVVGRSGRGEEKGIAVIQTNTPENIVISLAASQNYEEFYKNEIVIRKAMLYPPFADICMVGFVSDNHSLTAKAAGYFMNIFVKEAKENHSKLPLRILGPSPASIAKVSNKYRYKILIKCRNNKEFRMFLADTVKVFNSVKEYKNVTVYVDMNALSF